LRALEYRIEDLLLPPSLVALSGRLQGQTFDLTGDGLAIGRHPSNDLAIPDAAVSRHHCVLRRIPAGWRVADLDSRHGTFVNGRPVHEEEVRHGDVLGIGESTFLILLDTPAGEETGAGEDVALEAGTEILLPAGASVYLRPVPSGGRPDDRPARALAALLDLAAACGAPRDPTGLAREALERVLTAIPAERAAFVLADGGDPVPLAVRPRSFLPSRSLAERALREKTAILYTTGGGDASASVAGIRAAACVPLFDGDAPLGFLYVDTHEPGDDLEEDHLQWLSAAGALIAPALAVLRRLERAEAESRRLQESVLGRGLVGESPTLRRAAEILARAAPTASTVLILGESGTGKEMAARALHAASPRAGKPFVAINCASLSENLLESELFGHEQGAFTGAVARKTGKLEVAHGGTLFLDEVGELPPPLQAKLLRVLQERTFERVGGTRPITVDIRLVAATNRDLKKRVVEGTFRDDLFYRLNVITLTMPALRERREDIPLLASHFAALHGRAVRGRPVGIAPAARELLVRHDWPGNVRELSNAIERAVVLGLEAEIRPEDLPESLLETAAPASSPDRFDYHEALNEAKRRIIRQALDAYSGNVTRAAERLGLHANHLHRLITSLGLR
jgi:transcriptional regulator with GAF, ATPase, and Fis domain